MRVLTPLTLGGIAAIGLAVWWLVEREPATADAPLIPGDADRVAVEVLNGTQIDGLARSVTRRLRRSGIDVVFFGTAADQDLDSTRIVIRRGDSTVALRIGDVLGIGRVVIDRDERLLLDASVILGRDAAPLRTLDP